MSASYGGLGPEHIFTPMTYGPPPGLPAPQGISHPRQNLNGDEPHEGEQFIPYSQGREVSVPSTVLSQCGISTIAIDVSSNSP